MAQAKKTSRARPPQVIKAIVEKDTEALSVMGRIGGKKGGITTARRKKEEFLLKEVERQRLLEEMRLRDEEANLHTHPIDND
jgi:hypothetical protein